MKVERIPVSLSKKDYAYLNYIRQSALYSGKPISDLPEIGSILKGVAIHSMLDILGRWEQHGRQILYEFFYENHDEKAMKKLPNSEKELNRYMERNDFKRLNVPSIQLIDLTPTEKTENETIENTTFSTSGMTNYILTMRDDEKEILEYLRTMIGLFSDENYSYSEIIRFLFRYVFMKDNNSAMQTANRTWLLDTFYIFGLYGYTPPEAVLMSRGYKQFMGFKLENINILKRIYTDQTLFDIYLQEAEKIQDNNLVRLLFNQISTNNSLDEKYKSIVSGFSFHSALIGFILLRLEWYHNQHSLPLIIPYFLSEGGIIGASYSLKAFSTLFHRLFELSEKVNKDVDYLSSF